MSQPPSGAERRRNPRVDHIIPLRISSDDVEIVTETQNLSCSGVYCRSNKFIEPMTKLKIHLLLPFKKNKRTTTKKISCQGVVVRSEAVANTEHFNVAIFFNDISPKDIQTISDFVEIMIENKSKIS